MKFISLENHFGNVRSVGEGDLGRMAEAWQREETDAVMNRVV